MVCAREPGIQAALLCLTSQTLGFFPHFFNFSRLNEVIHCEVLCKLPGSVQMIKSRLGAQSCGGHRV